MTQQPTRICILGGGFGGLYTALRLSQLPWERQSKPEIVLIDRNDHFLFLPLLYELITGELQAWEIAPPFQSLLAGTGIRFHQGEVETIDVDQKSVQLRDGAAFSYDRLVLAFGGEAPLNQIPGEKEHAFSFRSIADASRLKDRLERLQSSDAEKIRVAIVGAGYSGVELACKVADLLGERGRIRLIDLSDRILRNSTEFNREAAQKSLDARKIWVDLETSVDGLTADSIALTYKNTTDTIPVDVVIMTIGTRVAEVITALPLKHNQRGQIVVTPTLQAIDRPEVFALGDIADCKDSDGQQVSPTAQTALQQADYVSWNIWASLSDRPTLPFRYFHLGEMMTLGQDNATLTALGIKLDGVPASVIRKLVYLYRMPTLDHQLQVGLNWLARPIYSLLSTTEK